MRIGIDVMGSESSPVILLEAIAEAAKEMPDISFVAFCSTEVISNCLIPKNIEVQACSQSIEMEDDPLTAIRTKKDSTLVKGVHALREKKIDAFITSGNTGALIVSAKVILEPLPGIDRPALLAVIPSKTGFFAMIDVGGSVTVKVSNLIQFAHMGAAYQRCCEGKKKPTVGLLNIGVESKKGTAELREAFQLLDKQQKEHPIEFLGNVEGREAFEGKVDVLVTDGFTGNVFLKTAEGISSLILQDAKQYFTGKEIDRIERHYSYSSYPGAVVCGVDGVVIKCHGAATKEMIINSIKGASRLVRNNFLENIKLEMLTL